MHWSSLKSLHFWEQKCPHYLAVSVKIVIYEYITKAVCNEIGTLEVTLNFMFPYK